ncbi:protein Dr1-like [Petromyzon marinus]|uniref:protein Dr1-like n=1 Tax=Petromyzon marinus TaxID=7757 RepID=UPI003F72C857
MASPLGVGGPAHEADQVTLPYASVQRLVGELVPCLRLTAGARDLLRMACTRFVRHVSSEANTACAHAQRKTISPEHVIQALERLGLAGSMGELRACHAEFRALALSRRRRATRRLEALGVPELELLRQQQALIEQARRELLPPTHSPPDPLNPQRTFCRVALGRVHNARDATVRGGTLIKQTRSNPLCFISSVMALTLA